MEALVYILSWGSPIGIGIFLLCLLAGMWIFFWGISQLEKAKTNK
jgi:hypothetical protein